MFKIESYITPIILNYLTKYVKNIRPQDFQVSLWGGEVTFHNLDLRLDVLEQELSLPFEILSGHIHELAIQVPWTKITSEPIKVLINTIEFVLKSKSEVGGHKSTSNSPHHTHVAEEDLRSSKVGKDEDATSMGSGLAMKIINNINVQCQNIILKYIEEDIVVSMNVQYLSFSPANETWQPSVVDFNPQKVLMRKLINVSDLTICLDKRNSAGQIDVCLEPVLYRCTLEVRFLRKYNSNTLESCSTTRIGILSQALDLNLSSLQVPLLMRLIKFIISVTSDSESDVEGFSASRHNTRKSIDSTSDTERTSYLSWAWNLLPSINFDGNDEVENNSVSSVGHIIDIGIYVEELNFTLKNSEFINDAMMGGIKRIRYMPIVRFSFGGLYFENVSVKEIDWSSTKTGISSLYVEPLGEYRSEDEQHSLAMLETAPFTNMRSFIDKSLFDETCKLADRGWRVTNYEDYITRITDDYLLYRSPIFAFDGITYRLSQGEHKETNGSAATLASQYRVLSSGITFRYTQTIMQVINIINTFIDSYDSIAYSSNVEQTEIFDTNASTSKAKSIALQDQHIAPTDNTVKQTYMDGSPKLHPPLVEDYDALMQGIPLRKYKIELKRMRIEMYAKTEPELQIRVVKRLPNHVKGLLPFLQLYFEKLEGSLSTPLNPDKLVHTTCQLPDKPFELLNACYNNYELSVKDFSIYLVQREKEIFLRLITIPILQMCYGTLLQPHHWKRDEVPIKKLDIQCDQVKLEASKRELFASLYLHSAVWSYLPLTAIKLVDILNHSTELADSIALYCCLSKIFVKRRYYHTFDIWNGSLCNLTIDILLDRKSVQVQRYNVLNVTNKLHNNQNKWLELQIQYKKEEIEQKLIAIGIWMEKFHLVADRNLLDFLSFTCKDARLVEDNFLEFEVQTTTFLNPPASTSHHTSSAPSTSLAYQTNPSLPKVFGRKSTRNSNTQRKISQPEETIHYSSEKDEHIDYVTNEPVVVDVSTGKAESLENDEDKIKNYYGIFNSLIIYMDIAQSQIDVTDKSLLKECHSECLTRLYTPRILFKSTFSEYISRSSLRFKVNPPLTRKTTFNWTIQFIDLSLAAVSNKQIYTVLSPCQMTLTVTMTKRKQNVSANADITQYRMPTPQSPKVKPQIKYSGENITKSHQNSSVSSGSERTSFEGSEQYKESSSVTSASPKLTTHKVKSGASNVQTNLSKNVPPQIVCLNLHLDSSIIHLFGDHVNMLQIHLRHLFSLLELATLVTPPSNEVSNTKSTKPVKILTSSEENQYIKEFMELDSNSDTSIVAIHEGHSILDKISLFCQCTVAKIIAEIGNPPQLQNRNKIILELEDFLYTVDQGHDFTKYTSKIGNFNLNYHTQDALLPEEWHLNEYLRIRMIADTNDLPFLNVVITKVCLRDFYKRLGIKRKGETDRTISEVLVVMQAVETICDLDRIQEFVQPLCVLMQTSDSISNDQHLNKNQSIIQASDLPLMHIESKGITCYFPLENCSRQCCTVIICKIESINLTPNLQNPLQRKPLRPDVYGKAASMGILSIPGSIVEDRQYEMTIRKLSAASGSWNEILTHMRNKDHNFHTNPAVEWNNPERKQSLRLTEIFKNFTLIVTYAPNIVYNSILICGEAIEFNCSSDFVANLNTDQLYMIACHIKKLQQISDIVDNACKPVLTSVNNPATFRNSQSESSLYMSPISSSSITIRTPRSLNHMPKTVVANPDARKFSRLGSSSQFESIDEDIEPATKTDSGVQSTASRPSLNPRISRDAYMSLSSSSILLDKMLGTNSNLSTNAVKRQVPKTISLVAGVFCFKIFAATEEEDHFGKPLISCTISQPSFMTTQNLYDNVVNFSIFNLNVLLPSIKSRSSPKEKNLHLFTEPLIDTMPGEVNSTGIPPSLLQYRQQQTKQKMREIDIEISKPLLITISENYIEKMCTNLIAIYKSFQTSNVNSINSKCPEPICRKTKISLMKANTLNADRLHFKCNNISLRLTNHKNYECDLVFGDWNMNLKYLTRPEKCSIKYSLAAVYLRTKEKVVVHPIALKGSMNFISEPWNRLPLINVVVKFNVIHIDVSVFILQQLTEALKSIEHIHVYALDELQRFQLLNINDDFEVLNTINNKNLRQLKYPPISSFVQNNKCLRREEFYQDDLRAGAFQYVEISSDAVLPLPYQVQIIKKDYGIICWRYPQPRKMCKIHIYPVPMAITNPIHIKCRMEYFSDVHEGFLHFCDFWLTETNAKEIKLPEREVCANIWRVVILQSLVSVDGECFDTSEEDEELQTIPSINIDEVLGESCKDSDFILHPKVLVGCMRVDTTFQSESVPKIQMLLSCNAINLKLFNRPDENLALPPQLKKFNLYKAANIPQAFLEFCLQNSKFYSIFFNKNKYNSNVSLTCCIKYLDYGFLTMLPLLEETTLQTYFEVDGNKNIINVNIVSDRLRINFGPSVIHTLLSSKTHWEEYLDSDKKRPRYALIPKCVIVNRTMTAIAFGQSGTNERIRLNPKDCYLYSFRSDHHSQEITLYIPDEERKTVVTSKSIHIPLKYDSETNEQTLCVGSQCIIIKSKKLSSAQSFVLIKGQIELVSMVPHNLYLQFRRDDKELKMPEEWFIEKNGRCSFYYGVNDKTNLSLRLKLADSKMRARTGDIPLRTNKKLPWLVKVPVDSNAFISFWVRILREDIPNMRHDTLRPQTILISIWPIFEVTSMLCYPIHITEEHSENEIQLVGKGEKSILDVPATHLTEHCLQFKYNVPLGAESQSSYTLRLRSLDWQKFFWYDEEKWTINNALNILSKAVFKKWPLDDEEELQITRGSKSLNEIDVIYNTRPSREFSCTLNLEVSPWGIFINATGIEIQLSELSTAEDKRNLIVEANGVEMLFNMSKGFTIDIRSGASWIQSLPIFFDNPSPAQYHRHYIVNEAEVTNIVILTSNEIYKFVLKLKVEKDRKVLKLCSKFAIINHTETQLYLLPFALDHKENTTMKDVMNFDATVSKTCISETPEWENGIGISLTKFYDINFEGATRTEDTAFVYFVTVKLYEDAEAYVSIPIPLGLPFNRKCFSIQDGKDSISLTASLIEHESLYYLIIYEDASPAVLVSNQTDCAFIIAQTNASENSRVTSITAEYDGKHFEWYQVIQGQSKCYYTPPEWYTRFPEVEPNLSNITLALYNDNVTKKTVKWSKPIRTDKTWKKYLHIPCHGDVKVIICDKHRVIRIYIYYISQQMEFSVKDLRLRLSSPTPSMEHIESNSLKSTSSSSKSFTSITNLYTETPQFCKPDVCHHFRNECESRSNTKFRLFIKEIILSLHIDNPQQQCMKCEVVGLYIDDFFLTYDDSEDERVLNMAIPNLQIDNQLFSTGKYDFPVILCAEQLYEKTDLLPDPFYLSSFQKYLMGKTPMISLKLKLYEDEYKLSTVNCRFNPLRAYIEDAYITDFLNALVECEPSNCVFKPKHKSERKELKSNQIKIPQEVETQALHNAEPLLLRSFVIEPMSVLLSVHTSVRLYIALDHSPLSFSSYERKHLLTMPIKFGQSLGMHYLSGAIFGAGWVVGSLEILGSPSGLARSVTTGLKDFVSMPVRGLFRGPWGFVVGVTEGSASLLKNVTAGTVNSVTKLAASVARNLDRLSLDNEHIERTEALRRSRPQGFTEGFSQGMTGLGISILGAVGGLAHHTLEARSTVEVFAGISKGLVGAFTKPISGAAELVALAGQGMLQTVGFNAMPKQRSPSAWHNLSLEPSSCRIWKLLPMELASDQNLFYHEVTLLVEKQPKRGYVFLTSTVFAVIDGTCDKLLFAFPLDKVEVTLDHADKTLHYVHVVNETDDIDEDANYTNERIMNFLESSRTFTSDSLFDLLQTHTAASGQAVSGRISLSNILHQTLDIKFYISEHLGEHIIRYIKIINSKLYSN